MYAKDSSGGQKVARIKQLHHIRIPKATQWNTFCISWRVCVCVFVTHTHTQVNMCVCIPMHTCACACTHTHTDMDIHTRTHSPETRRYWMCLIVLLQVFKCNCLILITCSLLTYLIYRMENICCNLKYMFFQLHSLSSHMHNSHRCSLWLLVKIL
jgi:hypothetical protein